MYITVEHDLQSINPNFFNPSALKLAILNDLQVTFRVKETQLKLYFQVTNFDSTSESYI